MAQNNGKQQFDPTPRNIALAYSKMALNAPKVQGGKFPPSLSWDIWYMNPQLVFKAGFDMDSDVKGSYFNCRFDIPVAIALCELITKLADSNEMEMGPFYLDSKTKDKSEGAKPWDLVDQSRVEVGKDAEGIYLKPLSKESQFSVKFYIRPTNFHRFADKDNKDVSSVMMSAIYAKAYAKTVESFIIGECLDLTQRIVTKEKTRYTVKNNDGKGSNQNQGYDDDTGYNETPSKVGSGW